MLFNELVETSQAVAATSGRLEKIERLVALLRRLEASEAPLAVAYLCGRLPQGRIGIGPAAFRDARPAAPAAGPTLTLRDVDAAFGELAAITGSGSARARTERLARLFAAATDFEQRFLVRLVLGELRQGALDGIMVEAVGRAAGIKGDRVRRAIMLAGDLEQVAGAVLRDGEAALASFSLEVFKPLKPMLAQGADDVGAALARLDQAAFEFKLDGVRVQVHKAGDDVRVFTRRLKEVTDAVPEIVEAVRVMPAREIVLDGEVLALREDGRPQPFQVTMRRFGRRLDIDAMRRTLPLAPFFFDCLHADGGPLVDAPASERYEFLWRLVPDAQRVPSIVTADSAEAEEFLADALRRGHEGVMAKSLAAAYEAGARGASWLKIKPVRTLDLVVLGAEWGHGRRQGWLSNLHLGARDPATGGFVMLGKTFKGMTDEVLAWQTEKLQALEVARDGHTVYVRPELVVEIAYSDIQASPHYPGGVALRFARLKRYRSDKGPLDADTIDTVRAIHEAQ
jgi:DNA ligase-1